MSNRTDTPTGTVIEAVVPDDGRLAVGDEFEGITACVVNDTTMGVIDYIEVTNGHLDIDSGLAGSDVLVILPDEEAD